MRVKYFVFLCSLIIAVPSFAAEVNTDSIKAEMEKIEITNVVVKSTIEKYKKGVIKGDLESMTQLGVECMSGKNVRANLQMGINLLESAANQGYLNAQYDLGNYYFLFWIQKSENNSYFTNSAKWLRKASSTGDIRSIKLLGQLYFEYGKYKKEDSFINGSITLLKTVPNISIVNDKDEEVISVQALLGNIYLYKWHSVRDSAALREAKQWYRNVLRSKKEYPNYTHCIDSLVTVLSQGVPMSIDPKTEESANDQNQGGFPGGGMGGFPGGGMGGFPGGGMGGQQSAAPRGPQAQYPGGMFAMQQFVRSNTTYPQVLQDSRVKGNITVGFTIGTDGAVINPVIINGGNFLMEREALRTIMMMPDWIPAKNGETPVESKSQATVNFGSGGSGMGMMF